MNNARYDEMKKLMETARKWSNKSSLLKEQDNPQSQETDGVEPEVDNTTYTLNGATINVKGNGPFSTDLTEQEKSSFQEAINQFHSQVTTLVSFNPMELTEGFVHWGGSIHKYNMTFIYSIGDKDGAYIKSDTLQVTDDFIKLATSLLNYFKVWSAQWNEVLNTRRNSQ